MEHLTDLELASFFSERSKTKTKMRVVRHLLSGCALCQRQAAETLQALGLDVDLLTEMNEGQDFPEMLRVYDLIEEEKKRAKVSFAHLAPLGRDARLAALKRHSRYRKYGLALFVLDEVEALILKHNPARAKELLSFSMAITGFLRPGIYGSGPFGDLQLRQQTTLANVKRFEEDFAGALAALEEANDLRHLGIDPLEEARFFRVQADILYDLGEFEAAAESSAERAALCELVGDTQAQAKAVLQRAMILAHCDPEAGLRAADEGLRLLNPSDFYALISGVFTRAFCLVQLGRADDAADYLIVQREPIREVIDPSREIYFLWLDAKIMRARQSYRDAEELLSYVALRFRDEGMNQEMLLVHIDRIELRVETGRWKSALTLARHLTPELTKLGLRNDLLAMWATLQDSLLSRQAVINDIRDFYARRWKR